MELILNPRVTSGEKGRPSTGNLPPQERNSARSASNGAELNRRPGTRFAAPGDCDSPPLHARRGHYDSTVSRFPAVRWCLANSIVPIALRSVRRCPRLWRLMWSDAGGERAAIAYTILGCCRLADVNPVEYLRDVLPRLARRVRLRDLPDLLPSRWKAAREAAAAAAASPAPAASEPAPAVAG